MELIESEIHAKSEILKDLLIVSLVLGVALLNVC
jgi:hypothetical protein